MHYIDNGHYVHLHYDGPTRTHSNWFVRFMFYSFHFCFCAYRCALAGINALWHTTLGRVSRRCSWPTKRTRCRTLSSRWTAARRRICSPPDRTHTYVMWTYRDWVRCWWGRRERERNVAVEKICRKHPDAERLSRYKLIDLVMISVCFLFLFLFLYFIYVIDFFIMDCFLAYWLTGVLHFPNGHTAFDHTILNRVCNFIPDDFRANCFGSEYFEGCMIALQLDEQENDFDTWRNILGKKKWTHTHTVSDTERRLIEL